MSQKFRKFYMVGTVLFVLLAIWVIVAWFQLAWNLNVPTVFGLPRISWEQACGLLMLFLLPQLLLKAIPR